MIKELSLVTEPKVAFTEILLKELVADELGLKPSDNFSFHLEKRSIDARNRNIKINLRLKVFINEQIIENKITPEYKQVNENKVVHIIGAGPAGLFAALRCIELGVKPIIYERGKDIKSRRRDLALINKEHMS
jgi:uncharacterized FAD-dependent dehydrogenase